MPTEFRPNSTQATLFVFCNLLLANFKMERRDRRTYHPFSHFAYSKFLRIYCITNIAYNDFSGVDQVGKTLIKFTRKL